MFLIPKAKVIIPLALLGVFLSSCSGPSDPSSESVSTAEQPVLVEYLFVQHADSVSLQDGTLVLEGIGETVLFFSDRPHRIVGRETIEKFIESWDEGIEPFLETPPNAVLTIKRDDELRDLTVILKDPVLTDQTLVYTVEVLDGPTSGSGDDAALFIDAFGLEIGRPGRKGSGKPGGESRLGKPGGESRLGKPGDPGDRVQDRDHGELIHGISDIGRRASDVPREVLDDIL